MDLNTVYSVMYEKQYPLAMRIKCKPYLARESPKYEIRIFEPINGRIKITEAETRKIDRNAWKFDFHFGGILFFKKRVDLENLIAT